VQVESPVLELDRVTAGYDGDMVLRSVSVAVGAGEFVGLVGPNGSGKSTLLKVALGLVAPESGTVRLFGVSLGDFHAWPRVGYVPQHVQAVGTGFPASVREVVSMGRYPRLRPFQRFRAEDREAVDQAMEDAGIVELQTRLISELSGGQRQRVFVARALASQPDVLFLDEPAASIDPEGRAQFTEVFGTLNLRRKITVLYVSHDLSSLRRYLTRVVLIDRVVVFDGTVEDVEARPEFAGFLEEAHHFQHVIETAG
jgi:zinc transport system ATP-binding protein